MKNKRLAILLSAAMTLTSLQIGGALVYAEDFSAEEGAFEILTDPSEFSAVREALENDGIKFASAEVDMIPQNTQSISDEQKVQIEKMLDMLEDNDDVQNVYHNAEMDEV